MLNIQSTTFCRVFSCKATKFLQSRMGSGFHATFCHPVSFFRTFPDGGNTTRNGINVFGDESAATVEYEFAVNRFYFDGEQDNHLGT